MKIREWLAQLAESIFLWPPLGGITAIIGVLAGLLGSIYAGQIKSSLFAPLVEAGRAFGATYFWVIVSIFGIAFTGTFWAQARSSKRATNELKSATHTIAANTDTISAKTVTLDELVRRLYTLPPAGFLEKYREAVTLSYKSALGVLASHSSIAELEVAIRTHLLCLLRLSASYDQNGEQLRYGCNVMLFRSSATMSSSDCARIKERLILIEKAVAVENLEGVLELIPELSVCSTSGYEPDAEVRAIALPVQRLRQEEKDDRKNNGVLPGGPEAFVYEEEAVIESLDELLSKADGDGFTRKVREELTTYLRENSINIQSFTSIPLYDTEHAGDAPIGILNIHRNRENHQAADKFELLSPLLVPITLTLGRLVWTYRQAVAILSMEQGDVK